jgi:hypothetical protein
MQGIEEAAGEIKQPAITEGQAIALEAVVPVFKTADEQITYDLFRGYVRLGHPPNSAMKNAKAALEVWRQEFPA